MRALYSKADNLTKLGDIVLNFLIAARPQSFLSFTNEYINLTETECKIQINNFKCSQAGVVNRLEIQFHLYEENDSVGLLLS